MCRSKFRCVRPCEFGEFGEFGMNVINENDYLILNNGNPLKTESSM